MTKLTELYLTVSNALRRDEEGQGLVEYGLILALVAVAVIVVLSAIGTDLNTIFGKVDDKLK